MALRYARWFRSLLRAIRLRTEAELDRRYRHKAGRHMAERGGWKRGSEVITGCLVLAALPCFSQVTATFSPQPTSLVPGVTEYALTICGTGAAPFSSGRIYQAAAARIVPVPRSQAQAILSQKAKRSPWRYVPPALKLLGLGFSSLEAAQVLKINEKKLAAIAPVATAVLEGVSLISKDQAPTTELPAEFLPPVVQLPADGCAEFVMFARPQQGETAFSIEVR